MLCVADILRPEDIKAFKSCAEALVEEHWSDIERVAQALLARRTILVLSLLRLIDPDGRPLVPLELPLVEESAHDYIAAHLERLLCE